MLNNRKIVLLLVTLIALTITLSAISAADANDTADTQTLEKTVTHEATTTSNIEKTNTSTKTKEINKKVQTNTKTATKTVEVNNFDEFNTAMNSAVQDAENDEYIINLNEGTYVKSAKTTYTLSNSNHTIIINANNQTINAPLTFKNSGHIIFNNMTCLKALDSTTDLSIYDSIISNRITPRSITLNIQNSALNSDMQLYGNSTIIIGDGCTVSEQFKLANVEKVTILTNNTAVIEQLKTKGLYVGNNTIKDTVLTTGLTNKGNLTITNSTMDASITNYGVLVISDDTTFGGNLRISGNGEIIINDTGRIASYLPELYGNVTIENRTVTEAKQNYGNLTVINSTMGNIGNHGNVSFINSTLTGTLTIYEGTLIFADDVTFGKNFLISVKNSTYEIIINDTSRISPYFDVYYGDNIVESANINAVKTNNGNLTINNSNLTKLITNNGNLVINNSVFNKSAEIVNNGNLTIINSEIINCKITNNGNILFENTTINRINQIGNPGTIILNNSIVNSTIYNTGTVIITDNTVFTDSLYCLSGNGVVIADDINKYFRYISQFTGETTIELGDYDRSINNLGNLTIENSTLTKPIQIRKHYI